MMNRTTIALVLLTVALVVYGALFAPPLHPEFVWHDLPGHMALIGFAGCVLIVLFAKGLGYLLVQRWEEDEHERH